MRRKIDWETQLGRRLKLRDLHVFFTVADRGSMAKAAAQLGVTAPTVSEVVADLEHALGVKLLDRSTLGVVPTIYGKALLKGGRIAFDELKQSIRDIEFLANPTVGELRIMCDESICAAMLPSIIRRFTAQHPRVTFAVEAFDLQSYATTLRDRKFDLVLTRRPQPDVQNDPLQELKVEILFNDELVVAAGRETRLARRRKLELAELAGERWILTAPGTLNYELVAEAFRTQGLTLPQVSVSTFSVHLRTNLVASGEFITAFPRSVLRLHADRFALKELPVTLPARPWPVALLTLKHRTLSPIVERFIACAHEIGRSLPSQKRQANK
ncbi:MAG TPA: LysR family transcriptional regulator [Beijerinckiaceae bacterium]|jgi:DNA-binding transcriptional LysR family regulator|nr:LysR family transcriptional regulator [Beijerinckiaceae bacterium]